MRNDEAEEPLYAMSEVGIAQRLIHDNPGRLVFVPSRGLMTWNGCKLESNPGAAETLCIQQIETMRREAQLLMANPDPAYRQLGHKLDKHAQASDSARTIRAVCEIVEWHPDIRRKEEDLDPDAWLLNVANSVIDLRTGIPQAHDPSLMMTRVSSAIWDSTAECPQFLNALTRSLSSPRIAPEHVPEWLKFVQRAIGYSLTGSAREQVLFICYGPGRNGKSLILNLIANLLGEYAAETPAETLMMKRYGDTGISNDLARLAGIRFVGANETEDGQRLAEAKVKSMTGGDKITARFMRKEFFEFEPKFKLWLRTNHLPAIWGNDDGIWRRIILIPFDVTIAEHEVDKDLPAKLEAEMSGILNWAVQGCLEWQQKGLAVPLSLKTVTAAYRDDMDSIGRYLESLEPKVYFAGFLYTQYQSWCETNGEKVLNQTVFGRQLTEKGWTKRRGAKGVIKRYPPDHLLTTGILPEEPWEEALGIRVNRYTV